MKITTAMGKVVDVGDIMRQNANTIAVGNASMNARGDEVDSRGNIIRKREKVMTDYYVGNPKSVRTMPLNQITPDILTPDQVFKRLKEDQEAGNPQMPLTELEELGRDEYAPIITNPETKNSSELIEAQNNQTIAARRRRNIIDKD